MSTTVNLQPEAGWPSEAFGTLKVMKREIGLALIDTVPSVVAGGIDVALAEALDLDQPAPRSAGAILKFRVANEAAVEVVGGRRVVDVDVDELRSERAAEGRATGRASGAGR